MRRDVLDKVRSARVKLANALALNVDSAQVSTRLCDALEALDEVVDELEALERRDAMDAAPRR